MLDEYKQTRNELQKEFDDKCKSYESLIVQIKAEKDVPRLRETEEKFQLIKQSYNFMIGNLEYTIDWIEHGREPGKRRGVDRTSVYLKDPAIIDAAIKYKSLRDPCIRSEGLTLYEKELVEEALYSLTNREKEVFLLIKVEGLTFEFTGELLGLKKTSVQTHYERAVQKIKKRKISSVFLSGVKFKGEENF